MSLIDALNWRYATKRMNGESADEDGVARILDAIHLAPSSYGLQPYSVLVIRDPALRARLAPAALNQPQITEGSHLLVFAAWDPVTPEQVDQMIARTAARRGLPEDKLDGFRQTIKGTLEKLGSDEARYQWAAKQAYLGLGIGLAAAALEHIDASPMEGFDPAALDRLLELPSRHLRSVALMVLGHRDEDNDWLAPMEKVRWPRARTIIEL